MKKKIYIIISVALLLSLSIAAYLYLYSSSEEQSPSANVSNQLPSQNEQEVKDEEGVDQEVDDGGDDDTPPEDTKDPSDNQNIEDNPIPIITSASDQGDTVVVRAFVEAQSSDDCILVLESGGAEYTKAIDSNFSGTTYDCIFNIPQAELSTGDWRVVVYYSNFNGEGSEAWNISVN